MAYDDPDGLTWVSLLSLQAVFAMLSVGSWNSRDSWVSTVLRDNRADTHKEERGGRDEAQPLGLSERTERQTASGSEENSPASFYIKLMDANLIFKTQKQQKQNRGCQISFICMSKQSCSCF